MGGYGSTRWNSHNKKIAVEDCHRLPISCIKKHLNVGWSNELTWSRNGEKIARISYEVKGEAETPLNVWLIYTITRADNEKIDCKYPVNLTSSALPWGGLRYWFICPGVGCGKRVSVLYLAPGGKYFACRHCYGLSYRSRQEGYQNRVFFENIAGMMQDQYPGINGRVVKRILGD